MPVSLEKIQGVFLWHIVFNRTGGNLKRGLKLMDKAWDASAERRYDRIAWVYDWMEFPMETMAYKKWRKKLLAQRQPEQE